MGRVRAGGKRRVIKKWPPPLWRGLFLFCLVAYGGYITLPWFIAQPGSKT